MEKYVNHKFLSTKKMEGMMSVGLNKIWYLKKIDVLSGLSDRDINYIAHHSLMKTYKKGNIIYFSDSDVHHIFFLKKGRVKLYKSEATSGKELVYAVLKENESFGSISPVNTGDRNEFAEAIDDTLVCIIKKDLFFNFIKDKPSVALRLNKLLGLRIYELEMLIEDLTFKSVSGRIISLLIKLFEKFGTETNRMKMINIPLTHHDIASMVGATRESTTIALKKLKTQGLIESKNKRIIIKDLERLQNISEGEI